MSLSLGDFLEVINGKKDVKQILQATEKRIKKIIPFETCVLYHINEEDNSDFIPAVYDPDQFERFVKNEIEFMVDAIRCRFLGYLPASLSWLIMLIRSWGTTQALNDI